jgi:hypothetical protein
MNFKELRIGNWVSIEPGWNKQWDLQDYADYGKNVNGEWSNDKVEPIPLTPEILEKAGFVKTTSKLGTNKDFDYVDYRLKNMVCYPLPTGEIEIEFCKLGIEDRTYIALYKYLHQLQNLFYCLTGEELIIEL